MMTVIKTWLVKMLSCQSWINQFQSLETNTQTLSLVRVWLKSLLPTTLMTSWLVNAITCHKLTLWMMTVPWMNWLANSTVWTALKHVRLLLRNWKKSVPLSKLRKWLTQLVTQSVQVCPLSHVCLPNGSLRWINWRKMLSQTKTQTTRLISTHLVSTIPSFNGWKMFTTG